MSAISAGVPRAAVEAVSDEVWVARHAPFVAAIATRLLGSDVDVDDVVQDVMIQTVAKRHTLRDPNAVRAWLGTTTVRRVRWVLRRRKLRVALGFDEHGVLPGPELFDRTATPETWARVREVYRALARLPIEQRLAWTLRFVEGQKLDEVARSCSTSLATAKRRIAAAQTFLRRELGDG